MKKKKILITVLSVLSALLALIFIFIVTISLLYHNANNKYRGFDKNVLINYQTNENIRNNDYFGKYFVDFVNYEQYEQEYNTDFYYSYYPQDIVSEIILIMKDDYLEEGYSYIIKCSEQYETLKNQLLNTVKFIKTPIEDLNDNVYYIDSIEFDDWLFKEIYFYPYDEKPYWFEENIREMACWLGYNDLKKEITFSYTYDLSLDLYRDEESLKNRLRTTLYT